FSEWIENCEAWLYSGCASVGETRGRDSKTDTAAGTEMNPGPVEEVSKATNKFIDTMAAQPLALALVFMNVCLLALFWFIFAKSSDHAKERERQMFEEQAHVRELLSKCVVPSGGTPQGQFPNLTPTNVAWFWEKKGEPFTLSAAGEVTLLKPEQERRINDLMQEAIDESLKTQIGHLFE